MLSAFVAALLVTIAAPFVHPVALDLVCSTQGAKLVAHEGGVPQGADHAAHCPLCLPGGAPPAVAFEWDAGRVPPLAPVRRSIPAARLASLIGAPLPPRGPPAVS